MFNYIQNNCISIIKQYSKIYHKSDFHFIINIITDRTFILKEIFNFGKDIPISSYFFRNNELST